MYGAAMVEELTDAWKKTSPVELDVYRTDAACQCGEDDCEACETDDACDDRTRIEIPDWENGEGLIQSMLVCHSHRGSGRQRVWYVGIRQGQHGISPLRTSTGRTSINTSSAANEAMQEALGTLL